MANKIPLVLDDNANIEQLRSTDAIAGSAPDQAGHSGEYLTTDGSSSSWSSGNAYEKTGWNPGVQDAVTLTFTDGTRTVAIAPTGDDVPYYIGGTLYTLSTEQTVVVGDVEGRWYIYFDGSTLTASQAEWEFDNTKAFVMSLYWDATNNENIGYALELHTWEMQDTLRRYLHHVIGVRHQEGLGVAYVSETTINVAPGELHDEDIEITVTDDAGSGFWDQTLSPLSAPILYRSGTGVWRKFSASTALCYLDTNIPQVNIYSGTWGWAAVTVNQYFAYWVVSSGSLNEPIFLIPGQEDSTTLNNAIAANQLAGMSFGDLPQEEHKVIARLIIKRKVASPYYELIQVDDYRFEDDEFTSGTTVADHGNLTGLSDDDHAQYHNDARAVTWIGLDAAAGGKVLTADGASGYTWETPVSGVTDHGALTGLGDDDHSAVYYNTTRLATYIDDTWPDSIISGAGAGDVQSLVYVDSEWEWREAVEIKTTVINLYVKTTGNDTTGNGEVGTPWATVDKALEVVGTWLLQARVNINIEKGTYTDASQLVINHAQGGLIYIQGDTELDTGTLSATNNLGASGVDYTIDTTDTSFYTVDDKVLIYAASGGSNYKYCYGTCNVESINSGVSVTLRHPVVTATAASGAVAVSMSIPQVKWTRRVKLQGPIGLLEGIQNHYNFASNTDFFLIDPVSPTVALISQCIWHNTNATRGGYILIKENAFISFSHCGMSRLQQTYAFTAQLVLTSTGTTDCDYGFRGYISSTIVVSRIHCVGTQNIALWNQYMSITALDAATTILWENGTPASPVNGGETNQNSWMTY